MLITKSAHPCYHTKCFVFQGLSAVSSAQIHKFCGNESGQTIHIQYDFPTSMSNYSSKAEIVFKSNAQVEGKGFNLRLIHSRGKTFKTSAILL